jgi:hypothetical protein
MNRKKLRLNVDELKVEAFATADGAVERGTVHGRDNTAADCTWDGYSCEGQFCPLTYPANSCYC